MNLPTSQPPRQMTILAESNPASLSAANGGRHRTLQLHSLVEEAGIRISCIPVEKPCSNLYKYLLGAQYLLQTGLANGGSLRLVRRYGSALARVKKSIRSHQGEKVLLWEVSHPNNIAVAHFAKQAGFNFIATPHNLESLVLEMHKRDAGLSGSRVRAEMRAYARAGSVFCISREEQWLLALHGVDADYLPYYPVKELETFLLSLRPKRAAVRQERLLILGSCVNPPTAEGMREQLQMLKSVPGGPDLPVDIVGSKTEALRPLLEGTRYQIHGLVSQEALSDFLVNAKAVLVHQKAAAGALTRIPEMLIAGVPVIANPVAARSALGFPGVHVYDSSADLHQIIGRSPLEMPPPPQRPIHAQKRFIESLLKLVEKGTG